MAIELFRINTFRAVVPRAMNFITTRPTLNNFAARILPVTTSARLGITFAMTPERALKILRMPLPNIESMIEAKIAVRSGIFDTVKAGLNRISSFLGADRFSFGMQLACAGVPLSINERDIPSNIFFRNGESGPAKPAFSGEESLPEVIAKISGGNNSMRKLLNIIAELGKIEGVLETLERSGIDLDSQVGVNTVFTEFIERYCALKMDTFRLLNELKLPEDQSETISKLNQEAIAKNEKIARLEDELRQLKLELEGSQTLLNDAVRGKNDIQNRFNLMLEGLKTSDLGAEQKRAEQLQAENTRLKNEIKGLNIDLENAKPALIESEALKADLELILNALYATDPEKVSLEGIETDIGAKIAGILSPVITEELPNLRALRETAITDMRSQIAEIQTPISNILKGIEAQMRMIENAYKAQIEVKDATLQSKNSTLVQRDKQIAEMSGELIELGRMFNAYQEITSILNDLEPRLKKAQSGKILMSDVKKEAVGLFGLLTEIKSAPNAEAKMPELLKKMVNKLIVLITQEEALEETAAFTKQLIALAKEAKVDFSKIKVVKGDREVAMGVDEALENLDNAFASFEEPEVGTEAVITEGDVPEDGKKK